NVMRAPRIRARLVLPRPRVAAGVRAHLEDDELIEPFFLQPPRGAEAGDAAADDRDRDAGGSRRRPHPNAVPDQMASRGIVVDERTGNRPVALDRQADERGGRRDTEFPARRRQRLISRHSASSVRTSTWSFRWLAGIAT